MSQPFDELVPLGWSLYGDLRAASDADAPISPGGVGAMYYPAGFRGGGAPGALMYSGLDVGDTYVRFGFEVSANWYGHAGSGVAKILSLVDDDMQGGSSPFSFIVQGSGSNELSFQVRTQGTPGGGVNYSWNQASNGSVNGVTATAAQAEIVRGEWRDIEVRIVMNTPGSSDGEIHVWMDGVKVMEYTGQEFVPSTSDGKLDKIMWGPIYGGGSKWSVPADQYQYIDHLYVSGRPAFSGASGPNEPRGFEAIVSHPFDVLVPQGWSLYGDLRAATDGQAPISPPGVGAMYYPAGFRGGGAPGALIYDRLGTRDIYLRFGFEVSANWYGHAESGIAKVLSLVDDNGPGGGASFHFSVQGSGTNELSFQVRTQGTPRGEVNYSWHQASDGSVNGVTATAAQAEIVRGEWRDIEVRIVVNTPGSSDGEIHVWVDGEKVMEYRGQELVPSTSDGKLDQVKWGPIYGGGSNSTVPADQYQYIDDLYVSGPLLDASGPNEPQGFQTIVSHPFNVLVPQGWSLYGDLRALNQVRAPISPPGVGGMFFPAGFRGGSGPGALIYDDLGVRDIYVRFGFRVSGNWYGHAGSGVAKILFLVDDDTGQGAGAPFYFSAQGNGSNELSFQVRTQGTPRGQVNYSWRRAGNGSVNGVAATAAQAEIVRGVWRDIEVHILVNTPGSSDGEIHVWMDGVKVMEYTGQEFVPSTSDGKLDKIKWGPIYGGGSKWTVPRNQWQFIDHVYVSGR